MEIDTFIFIIRWILCIKVLWLWDAGPYGDFCDLITDKGALLWYAIYINRKERNL